MNAFFLSCIWDMKALTEVHFQWTALHVENVGRSTFSYPNEIALHWKCTSVNAFIPQWNLVRHWLFTSDVVMEACANSDLSFIGMWNISFIIMWPLHNQPYCNISMKNGSNVIIRNWKPTIILYASQCIATIVGSSANNLCFRNRSRKNKNTTEINLTLNELLQ